jgi:hypothetical protein
VDRDPDRTGPSADGSAQEASATSMTPTRRTPTRLSPLQALTLRARSSQRHLRQAVLHKSRADAGTRTPDPFSTSRPRKPDFPCSRASEVFSDALKWGQSCGVRDKVWDKIRAALGRRKFANSGFPRFPSLAPRCRPLHCGEASRAFHDRGEEPRGGPQTLSRTLSPDGPGSPDLLSRIVPRSSANAVATAPEPLRRRCPSSRSVRRDRRSVRRRTGVGRRRSGSAGRAAAR